MPEDLSRSAKELVEKAQTWLSKPNVRSSEDFGPIWLLAQLRDMVTRLEVARAQAVNERDAAIMALGQLSEKVK